MKNLVSNITLQMMPIVITCTLGVLFDTPLEIALFGCIIATGYAVINSAFQRSSLVSLLFNLVICLMTISGIIVSYLIETLDDEFLGKTRIVCFSVLLATIQGQVISSTARINKILKFIEVVLNYQVKIPTFKCMKKKFSRLQDDLIKDLIRVNF